jgi:uncharacterized protein (DUF1015 family)
MATIKPFCGLRYDLTKANTAPEKLICPPYDVIDPAMQEALYQSSPYNVVRIEYGKQSAADTPGADRYSRAAATFLEWQRDGILSPDAKPAFYLYEQTFDVASGGASQSHVVTRRGVLGAFWLEPFATGCVYPHEETFGAPKADRLALMRACQAHLSPVFGLVPDKDNSFSKLLRKGVAIQVPDFEATEQNGVVNKLWAITDEAWCASVAEALKPRKVFIADGHHRYETSCNYRDERRREENDPRGKFNHDYNYTLMMCVPMSDPGLYILPTHRLIQNAPGLSKDAFLAKAKNLFDVRPADVNALLALSEEQTGSVKIGAVFSDSSMAVLTARPAVAETMVDAAHGKSHAWRELDVSVVQEILLKRLLGLSEESVLRKEGLSYTPNTRLAIKKVTSPDGGYVMGFILRPTRIEQVREVASGGEKMPQKSTYFYPKLLTGMVIHKS